MTLPLYVSETTILTTNEQFNVMQQVSESSALMKATLQHIYWLCLCHAAQVIAHDTLPTHTVMSVRDLCWSLTQYLLLVLVPNTSSGATLGPHAGAAFQIGPQYIDLPAHVHPEHSVCSPVTLDYSLPLLFEVAVTPAPNVQQILPPLQADLPRAGNLAHPELVQCPLQRCGLHNSTACDT